jgi:hypothetical protein
MGGKQGKENKENQHTAVTNVPATVTVKEDGVGPHAWTMGKSLELQKVVDELFAGKRVGLTQMEFSFSIADPTLQDCPLVGCSEGFSRLTGYGIQDILGVSCRILLNGVPPEMIEEKARMRAREFCNWAMAGKEYRMLDAHREDWMPPGPLPMGETFIVQTNARRDGTLFKNMFYLKQVELDEHQYIVGLQGEIPEDLMDDSGYGEVLRKSNMALEKSMDTVELALSGLFWYEASMRRQD